MRKFTTSGILANEQFSLPKHCEEFFLDHGVNILSSNAANTCKVLCAFTLEMAFQGLLSGIEECLCSNPAVLSIPVAYQLGSLDSDSKDFLTSVLQTVSAI